MDYEPAEYRKLTLKQFPARALRETAEGKYWKRFSNPVNAQQVRPLLSLFCTVTVTVSLLCYICAKNIRHAFDISMGLCVNRLALSRISASLNSTATILRSQAQQG